MLRQVWNWPLAAVVVVSLSTFAAAQGPPGRGGGFGGPLDLVRSDAVAAEIELVDDQKEQLQALNEELREEMRAQFQGFRDLSEDERTERFAQMRENFAKQREKTQEKLNNILLPHQVDRLRQIELQSRMRQGGASGVLRDNNLREKLGITDEQIERMQEAAEKAREEMTEKVAKLRKEAEDKVLNELTPTQRQQWEEMFGKQFEFPAPQGGFGGRRGGPGGAPGGRRGGGDN
ncbi:hypothetical protein [Lignipirellula cremea]|uniref:Periplasmic repressor CpxP n=1 Tax=Lignipirellula cremea TaxID=2528010 RepID=A0A518DNC1_9BACT|nr:hypothetical protein [Lignipirellula cremea]QDU93335.1 periplasmic repressor CpxP [Lignipirellula cremea]